MGQINSLRGAPAHIQRWWRGTGTEAALFRLVEQGSSWEAAHKRLKASYQRWWDSGRIGQSPLWRLSNAVIRRRVLDLVAAGKPHKVVTMRGKRFISVDGFSLVEARDAA